MTTMFVQLRRVVYLLVLLQCCVCVAYAESVTPSAEPEEKDILQRTKELKAKMNEEKSKTESVAASLRKAREECNAEVQRAQNAASKAHEDEKLIMEADIPHIMGMTENVNEIKSELKVAVKKAVYTVREATDAANKSYLIANKTKFFSEEFLQMSMQLKSVTV
ncbi:uncharacterized protein TM35_000123380 [Trypanosoma theileri]|uniref:Uncharacterized protein n=1 Tax=Trypanosoma theileri TaxID=67003 RepID=A0A1X0NYM0_9TRYP|nr:uncharacterized protein TM35_000123380 [Trypanosoma theileri]ORC89563.1 hypothetical protein TM35_000123380 [Trypanosoma theileri]